MEQQDIEHIISRIKHPQFNSKVEKAGSTIRKLAKHFGSQRRALLYYNFERPHRNLNLDECETPFKAYLRRLRPPKRDMFVKSNFDLVAVFAPKYLEEIVNTKKYGG